MTFDQVISTGVQVVEAAGAAIMVFGGGLAFAAAVPRVLSASTRRAAYQDLRRSLGRAILLGLEVLIVARRGAPRRAQFRVSLVFALG